MNLYGIYQNNDDAEVFQAIYDEESTRYIEDLNHFNERFDLVSKAILQTGDLTKNQSVRNSILSIPGNDNNETRLRAMRIPEGYELDPFINILRKEFTKLASITKLNQHLKNKFPLENIILNQEEMEANSSNISDLDF